MTSMFREPRPAKTIVETYGCLAYHSGLLRNGVPSAEDNHAPHGEAPCAEMDQAGLACGADAGGPWMAVTGVRDYAMGFSARYRATPRVVLRREKPGCDIVIEVQNLSADAFAANPARLKVLNEITVYNPELVLYIKGLKRGPDGLVHLMLVRREGDAFAASWDPESMPHCIRWILDNKDQRVAAFAMPATCEPEGYSAEKRRGNVRLLASGACAAFATNIAFVSKHQTAVAATAIEGAST
jgi:hypothetical protein